MRQVRQQRLHHIHTADRTQINIVNKQKHHGSGSIFPVPVQKHINEFAELLDKYRIGAEYLRRLIHIILLAGKLMNQNIPVVFLNIAVLFHQFVIRLFQPAAIQIDTVPLESRFVLRIH